MRRTAFILLLIVGLAPAVLTSTGAGAAVALPSGTAQGWRVKPIELNADGEHLQLTMKVTNVGKRPANFNSAVLQVAKPNGNKVEGYGYVPESTDQLDGVRLLPGKSMTGSAYWEDDGVTTRYTVRMPKTIFVNGRVAKKWTLTLAR